MPTRRMAAFLMSVWMCAGLCLPAQAFLGFDMSGSKDFKRLTRNAERAMERRQWHEALVYLEEARRRYPGRSSVQLRLAYLHRQTGLLAQARGHAQDAVHNSAASERDAALRELAWVEYRMYLYESALGQLAKIKRPVPADHALAARLWIMKAGWDEALAALDRLEAASHESALGAQEAALVGFWRDWCLMWKHGTFSAGTSLADPQHGGVGAVFADKRLAKGTDPWVVLGRMAWRSLSGSPAGNEMASMTGDAAGTHPTDTTAWRLLRMLR